MPQQKEYRDTWVKLLGSLFCSHFIEVMGRTEGFFQLLLTKSYLIALFSGFVIALLLWEVVSRTTVWLDARYDWLMHTVQRIPLQVLLGFCLPAALLYLLTFLQMKFLFQQDINKVDYMMFEFPAACLLIVIINAYYLIYYFYNRTVPPSTAVAPFIAESNMPISKVQQERVELEKMNTILVNKGAKILPVQAEEIACIYKNGEHTYIKTFNNNTFFLSFSLDELESKLDEQCFFRANRQTIVNRKACQSFSSAEYGKLELHLQPEHKEPVIISQKKAPAYKQWLQKHK